MKRWVPLAVVGLTVSACQDASAPGPQLSPPSFVSSSKGVPIAGSYIIKFRDDVDGQDVDNSAQSLAKLYNGALKHVYKSALKGFAVQNLSAAAAAAMASDPRVELIEPDQVMTASVTQPGATWGLDRVDQVALPLNGSYIYNADGSGVTVYIIDTGINFGHAEFGGRAVKGIDEVTAGGSAADCNGHGTHVSGTVAGSTYGLAKMANLVAVRVLDCSGSGSTSGVIAGVDWVTAQQTCTAPAGPKCGKPAAANMSLGGGKDALLNKAVANAVAANVAFAVAAGNSTADACLSSPSSEPSAITVGATDINDGFAYFSNFGSCVDINAPGVNITSAWLGTGTNTISGTSMASPHVAGAAALYLSVYPTATPGQVTSALTTNASAFPAAPTGTPKILLYTGFISGTPVTSVTVTPSTSTIEVGATVQLTATTSPAGRAVTWSSSAPTVATVSSTGLVKGVSSSSTPVTITATSEGKSGTASVTVNPAPPVTSVTVSPAASTIAVGQTVQLSATTTPSGRAVTWTSSAPSVATVDANGLVKGVSASATAVTITATSEGVSGTASVTVKAATVTSITISPTSANVAVGKTVQLTATTNPAGQPVTWTSSAPGIARVSSTGLVTGVAGGSAVITASSGGKSATSNVTVTVACSNGNCQN